MIAIIEAYKSGAFQAKTLLQNIIAGSIVGVITLPLSLAFAIASGAEPEQGIYTSIIGGFIVAIFGGTRFQISGPVGAILIVLHSISMKYGLDGLQVSTLMAGFILIAMGLLKLGGVIKFIPNPVIIGFTAGIAVVVFVSEWKDFFGLQQIPSNLIYFHEKIIATFISLPTINFKTTLIGIVSLAILIFAPKYKYTQHIPGAILALVFGVIVQWIFRFQDVATVGVVYGNIKAEFPAFDLPELSFSKILSLTGPAFTIALLVAIQSLLSAVIADGMKGTRHDSNQELIGQGIANVICPFFNGFATCGAMSRTATSIRNGATNPLAALVHCAVLILMVYVFAPLANYIPLTTLAAILFVIAYNMSDVKHFYYLTTQASKNDVFILLLTFVLTILTDLVVAVNIGVILSVLLFTRRMSKSVTVETEESDKIKEELHIKELPKDAVVYNIQGPFFFGAVERLEHTFEIIHERPRIIIFRLKGVPFMDFSGLETFREIIKDFHRQGTKVIVCEANTKVVRRLKKVGILEYLYSQQVFDTLKEAIQALKPSLK